MKKESVNNSKFFNIHYVNRANWLRAAVLGANDGIISLSSLVIGVAAASVSDKTILLTGVAGLIAGAMSMAAGEYVSVYSQADIESADLEREKKALQDFPELELQELVDIYIGRGVEPKLAAEVAKQMTQKDALLAHGRDELGINAFTKARPQQAALASAISFSLGAAFPVLFILILPRHIFISTSSILSVLLLGILGAVSAKIGGVPVIKPSMRIMFWGAAAMGLTGYIGSLFGISAI